MTDIQDITGIDPGIKLPSNVLPAYDWSDVCQKQNLGGI